MYYALKSEQHGTHRSNLAEYSLTNAYAKSSLVHLNHKNSSINSLSSKWSWNAYLAKVAWLIF